MALFQKRPQVSSEVPRYSIGAHKNVLIVGLGNIGNEHKGSRHNIGFEIVDYYAQKNDFPNWIDKKDLKAQITVAVIGDSRVVLAKPTTYMNNSGEAVQAIQRFYRIYNQYTLVIYDELALPFGQLRTRLGGSDAGHNGVKSLIQHIGEDFGRLRIGIGNELAEKKDAADFVLSRFNKEEQTSLEPILREANELISDFVVGNGLTAETRTVN